MTIQTTIAALLAKVTGESAAAKISRKQHEISVVTTKNTGAINQTIDAEIDAVATSARISFGRIDQLLGTGALSSKKAKAVDTARVQIDGALRQLDAALG